jgi:hypothetical protein
MKIVSIFANRLYAFHNEGENDNELRRLLKLWNDTLFVYSFVKENNKDLKPSDPIPKVVNEIFKNANEIDDLLNKISKDKNRNLEEFFKPLRNQEYQIVTLSKQKGSRNHLRLYAIKIDQNCFVITGGAIKFHHLNNQRPHTRKEMVKIDKCRDYLKANHIIDADSFYTFLKEEL